jgi:hypothetical protein
MKSFSKNRSISPALLAIFAPLIAAPLIAASSVEAPRVIAVEPIFQGQFESNDISSSGKWILEFKFENGRWSGLAKISNGKWAKIEGVKVNENLIEFYMDSKPISKFKAKIDDKNFLISGTQEIGDGRKNTFNNVFLPFSATRI